MGEAKRKREIGQKRPKDTRFVYGARCVWFGPIRKVGKHPVNGLPCCPHCKSMLFEFDSEEKWWAQVDQFEATGAEGYRKMIEWAADKHFLTANDVVAAYKAATGISVDIG